MPEFTYADIWLLDAIGQHKKRELQKAVERAERLAQASGRWFG